MCIGPPREAQLIFPIQLLPDGALDLAKNSKVVGGQKFALLDKVDPNPNNVSRCIFDLSWITIHLTLLISQQLVAAGVFHTESSKVGILIRVEPNKDAGLARITIRSTNNVVSEETLQTICKPLNKDTLAA